MAGAGYKLFNTGDVLTAQQVNEYLMQQTVMVFADASARTTALSGVLAEGMISYLKDTNAVERYDGSTWSAIGAGDIEGVTAGTGMTGGGTSGTVTLTNDMATTITAAGDIVVGTGNATYDNLPIGTTGQVLTADTTVSPYKVKWASAAAGKNFSEFADQSLTAAGATTVTVSGISNADQILILLESVSSANANSIISIRLNGDTGNNYRMSYVELFGASSYFASSLSAGDGNPTKIDIGMMPTTDASVIVSGYVLLTGCNSSGLKVFTSAGSGNYASGGSGQYAYWRGGRYSGTSTISSVSVVSSSGNLDAGRLRILTSA